MRDIAYQTFKPAGVKVTWMYPTKSVQLSSALIRDTRILVLVLGMPQTDTGFFFESYLCNGRSQKGNFTHSSELQTEVVFAKSLNPDQIEKGDLRRV